MDIECPECGSCDIDLHPISGFKCQECGERISDDQLNEMLEDAGW